MSFITSLISISSLATWIFLPLNAIFLTLDGIVYSLVAYSYKIFMLIAQLNYNVLYAWISPLLDRVKAIILLSQDKVEFYEYEFLSKMHVIYHKFGGNGDLDHLMESVFDKVLSYK